MNGLLRGLGAFTFETLAKRTRSFPQFLFLKKWASGLTPALSLGRGGSKPEIKWLTSFTH